MNPSRWLLNAVAAGTLALASGACSGREKGVLTGGDPPPGPLVALTFDATGGGGRLLKAYPQSLYASRDGGKSWQEIPLPRSIQRGRVAAVAAAPTAAGTLYIAGPGLGVLRTTDEGATWVTLNGGLEDLSIEAFAPHAKLDQTLYTAVAGRGIYRSEDGGKHWKRMDQGPGGTVRQLVHSDLAGSMNTGWLYAATDSGVRRSMDCFCGWRRTGALPDSGGGGARSVVVDPGEQQRVYASGDSMVVRSPDGGETWEVLGGRPAAAISLAFDSRHAVLYAATRDGVVLQSRDRGAHWTRTGG